jgi:hypothetical protein
MTNFPINNISYLVPFTIHASMLGCVALKKENPDYSNYDVREIVTKDCIEIWQKDTTRRALPDEYKDKKMQEFAADSHKNRESSGQTTEFDNTNTENRTFLQDSNPAQPGSVGSNEGVSEDFGKMNRGRDVITESERIKKLEQRLNEAEEERLLQRKERDELNTTAKVLGKTAPELLRELQKKFHDQPRQIDAKKAAKGYVSLFYLVKITV